MNPSHGQENSLSRIDLPPPETVPNEQVELFVRLLAKHQRQLNLYVFSLVLNPSDAEDILQETNLVLWREFHQFEVGTNFLAWAYRVAFNQVRAWRKRQQREHLFFSDAFLETVSQEMVGLADQLDDRSVALRQCIQKLPAPYRELLHQRYTEGNSIERMSQQLHRTTEAIYRMLSRIRQILHDCVTRTLLEKGS